ncbi:aldehyde dehydrogenase (NADP(+)) [Acrocarpospora macrocephala]|uniref:Aldehyde dehydrogenase n=1 Tax=Acrocarpospora macrocephala TaxID=150177 RepID=A0A5M3WUB4_9ACTN|nr:aldehyde dehydrogenase family protein [Acrocarpospora macrocephala]GES09728.1 aldehyde dehydrogenase [Acrocarpospora macrocephala]
MSDVWSLDPRTGRRVQLVAASTSVSRADAAAEAAMGVAGELVRSGRAARALLLRRIAAVVEQRGEKLLEVADRETALGSHRLTGELARTAGQLRLFADVVEDGSYQEAVVTAARTDVEPPVPDLRRMLVPLGPVAVFGAGNFPFAFSVLGGDTTAALAAGCPVVVKCHPGHPETSVLMLEAWRQAAAETGAPEDAVQLVFGTDAGRRLVEHPRIRAVCFTGSLAVGRELHHLAAGRPDPIPFYGELAGVNPLIVTPGAAQQRAEEIGRGAAASFTLNGGQFCTKPGLLFVPAGPDGDRLVAAAAAHVAEMTPVVMLTAQTRRTYQAGLEALLSHPRVTAVARVADPASGRSDPDYEGGCLATAALLEVSLSDLDRSMLRECFGPAAIVVRYESASRMIDGLAGLEGALAAAVHSTEDETELTAAITEAVLPKVGRVVYNGYPTGVAVTAAMTHGGPWPAASNALHSSVGPSAIRRFLRPVTYQNAPQGVVPEELRDRISSRR